jgi:arsenate reductase
MTTVLFVCVHNAGRSQMAEAMFNDEARKRGIEARAVSAGTLGAGDLNPAAMQALDEIGVMTTGLRPKQLTQAMVEGADKIVTMGCGVDADACPARFLATEDWGLDDPAGQPIETVRAIRDQIRDRVEGLLDSLA